MILEQFPMLLLSLLTAVAGSFCDHPQQNTDASNPVRVTAYPNGLQAASAADCCTACTSQPDCVALVYEPSNTLCWPLSSYTALLPGTSDRVFAGQPPPPPPSPQPAPADWAAAISAKDMLFSALPDTSVPVNSMPMVGNGFLATQVMSDSLWVAGLFNGYLTKDPSHRARLPATSAIHAPGTSTVAALHLREATYLRRSTLPPSPAGICTASSLASCSNANTSITIEQRWYAHRSRPSVMVHEVQILGVAAPAAPPTSADAPPFAMLLLRNSPGSASSDLTLTPGSGAAALPPGSSMQCGSTLIAEANNSGLQGLCIAVTDLPATPLAVPAGAPGTLFTFLTVVRTSIETPGGSVADLQAGAAADYTAALSRAPQLHAEHVSEWQEAIWPAGFETDRSDLALAVNSSLYALLSSVRNDRPFCLSPGGLTAGYHGHTFWDSETWMLPGINLLHPDTALTLLEYRAARLEGARIKAASYTPPFAGAMFPWESALTGQETCPTWAETGLREQHINGDIAQAVWGVWRGLQDNSAGFLNATAWPLLQGICTWWMSKLALDNEGVPAGGALSLRNVIPPDEYADHVNNSAFTNHGAIQTLTYGSAVSALLGLGRVAAWEDAAARIVRPHNATGDWTPEYDGYPPGTRIKQADVVLLGFPLEAAWVSPSTRASNLARYAAVTDPGGPAMTWGMHAVGYIELGAGYEAAAAANFNRSFANAQPPFLVWTETPTGGTPNFLTGAGGFLQTVLQGYSGLRVGDAGLRLSPALPQGASSSKLRGLAFLGARLDIEWDGATVQLAVQGAAAVERAAAAEEAPHCELCMAPAGRGLAGRRQGGRVAMAGGQWVVAQRQLQVVDAAGGVHALTPGGAPVVLPVQALLVEAAAQ